MNCGGLELIYQKNMIVNLPKIKHKNTVCKYYVLKNNKKFSLKEIILGEPKNG